MQVRPLDSREASQYLFDRFGIRRAPGTLNKLACIGGGPRFRKVGRTRIYDQAELDAYAAQITSEPMRSTSEVVA
jgi:hypothetical protein